MRKRHDVTNIDSPMLCMSPVPALLCGTPLRNSYLVDPVGVEDAQAPDLAADALLSDAAQVASGLQLGDTLAGRLAVYDTL